MIKKTMVALFAAAMLLTAFAACNKDEQTPPESVVEESSEPQAETPADPVENNQQIDENDVNLVQFEEVKSGDTIAVMKTNYGELRIKLFPDEAPKTVANFVGLAEKGYYNGITFHRVVDNFMIQGGDPTGTGAGGESIYSTGEGDPGNFEDEFSLNMWNFTGTISMANAGPGTNTSQFFIINSEPLDPAYRDMLTQGGWPQKVIDKYIEVGGAFYLDGKHTAFGTVVEGMDTVAKIMQVETTENPGIPGEMSVPVEPVVIESVTIETAQ